MSSEENKKSKRLNKPRSVDKATSLGMEPNNNEFESNDQIAIGL
jgi:hypothetical protein